MAVADSNCCTLTEITARSGLPLSTTHRLMSQLADWQLLERRQDGRYRIGRLLRTPGQDHWMPEDPTWSSLRERILPVMEDISRTTGSPVRAGFLTERRVAFFQKVGERHPATQLSDAARLPAHATALGKVLLAFSTRPTVDRIIGFGLTRYTSRTIVRPEILWSALHTARVVGIAWSDRELDDEWCAVAAPVFGPNKAVVAALELRVSDLPRDASAARAIVAVAAGCLTRDLAEADLIQRSQSS